jgi:aspartate racemase
MKRIGLVGGTGPESTKEYYMGLIHKCKQFNYPEIIIYSVNMAEIMKLQQAGGWEAASYKLIEVIKRLEKAGAEFGAICANTPHIVFDQVQESVKIPLISIVDATLNKGTEPGVKKPLLLGTKWTMEADFFPEAFKKAGIEIMVPESIDSAMVHRYIFKELERGIFKPDTKKWFLDLIMQYKQQGADSVILGCTELPLLISQEDLKIPALDTTDIHVEAIYEHATAD